MIILELNNEAMDGNLTYMYTEKNGEDDCMIMV